MSTPTDTYYTIEKTGEGFYKEKGSKFYGFAIPCTNRADAKARIDAFRKEHHNACHVCFAWRFGAEVYEDRFSDDGEPNNSAGKPIFGQVVARGVTNVLVAIVRYYGGTNLGVGGLINAYRTAAKEALENTPIITRYITVEHTVSYPYELTGTVMGALNKINAEISEQNFENNQPVIRFSVKRSDCERIVKEFEPHPTITLTLLN